MRDNDGFIAAVIGCVFVSMATFATTSALTNASWHRAAIEAGVGQWVMDETSGDVHFEFVKTSTAAKE